MGNVVIMFPLIELKTLHVWVNEEGSESQPEVGGPWFTQFVTSCDCLLILATPAGLWTCSLSSARVPGAAAAGQEPLCSWEPGDAADGLQGQERGRKSRLSP